MVVVLPAPLGPSREKIVPAGTFRSMPSSTTVSPNDLRSPAADTAAIAVDCLFFMPPMLRP